MDPLPTRSTIFLRLNSDDTGTRQIAWSDFRDIYSPIIAGFAHKLGVKAQDRDDIVQDVMLGFFSQAPKFVYDPAKGRFRGYLKVCTFRAMQRLVGGKTRFREVPLDRVDPEQVEVEQVWNDIWEEQLLQRALDATRSEFADDGDVFRAFELVAIKGQSLAEVAHSLGVSERTVYRSRARVRASLKRRLANLEEARG